MSDSESSESVMALAKRRKAEELREIKLLKEFDKLYNNGKLSRRDIYVIEKDKGTDMSLFLEIEHLIMSGASDCSYELSPRKLRKRRLRPLSPSSQQGSGFSRPKMALLASRRPTSRKI